MMVALRTPEAGVRKPPREETAGGMARPLKRLAAPVDVTIHLEIQPVENEVGSQRRIG
ncbi:hypothetical protein IVB22_39110 [Bradyrhizobium sp. 190]|uniref:hypothetical protein n=1 Tax=Bradyrhizobium sp. 190 TaxID=2782658 RepID=UPI001FF7EAD5|nr:hypothetical protein [Bradyrhizobium sp. 190]MCK1518384.1 hypothetical protein [Bradyrhizobium sp. 190]